jgi:hypothetical protein
MLLDEPQYRMFEEALEKARNDADQPLSGLVGECARVEMKEGRDLLGRVIEGCGPAEILARTVLTEFSEEQGQEALVQKMLGRAGKWGWRITKLRLDKSMANNIRVANNIMQTLVENIRAEEFK